MKIMLINWLISLIQILHILIPWNKL